MGRLHTITDLLIKKTPINLVAQLENYYLIERAGFKAGNLDMNPLLTINSHNTNNALLRLEAGLVPLEECV